MEAQTAQPASASADLVGALEAALGAAVAGDDAVAAVVGIVSPGEPTVTRERGVAPRVRDALIEAVLGVPDGVISSAAGGLSWRGYRAGLGDGRQAFAVVDTDGQPTLGAGRAEVAALVLLRAALLAADRRRRERLEQLLATARRVAESLDPDSLLPEIIEDASRLTGADSGDILLLDDAREKLRVVAVWNFPPEMIGFELDFGEGVSSQAIVARRPLSVEDYANYPHRARALDRYDFGGVLCAPLLVRGEAIGAINVHARGRAHVFGPDDADLLAAFAGHAAVAIDNARRYAIEVRLGRVAADSNRELSRSLTVQGRLVEQVLIDGGAAGIAGVLAEHLGRRIVIQDHLRRVVAGAAPDGGESWRALLEPGAGSEPFTVAVRIGRDVVGHLLVSSDDALDQIDRALVDIATTGVALEFAKMRAAAAVEERLRGEALADLLAGSYASEESIAARVARLGHDLGEPRDVLVLDVTGDGDDGQGRGDGPGGHDHRRRDLDMVRERLAARSPRSLAVVHGGRLVVLVARSKAAIGARELAADLKAAIESAAGAGTVTAAVGETCRSPRDYATALHRAGDAVDLLIRLGRLGSIVSVADLGPYALLLRASSRDDLQAFARAALAPLLAYDREHGGELVGTLRAYLDSDRVQRRAAARLAVHVNTIVYRVRRIEELLGRSLAEPDGVFDLTLALRIADVLQPELGAPD